MNTSPSEITALPMINYSWPTTFNNMHVKVYFSRIYISVTSIQPNLWMYECWGSVGQEHKYKIYKVAPKD